MFFPVLNSGISAEISYSRVKLKNSFQTSEKESLKLQRHKTQQS